MTSRRGNNADYLHKLAALVTQRRVSLGHVSKEAAAEACGISHTTYRKIEGTRDAAPERVRPTTYAKLEIAFGFRPGSCARVLDEGADSITLHDGTELIEGGEIRDFKVLEDEFDRAFDKSAQLTAPHLTLSEAKAMKDEMLRLLRERGVLKSS
ncbi:hypothetical protein ABZV65_19885 [Streptomyces bauhiniae]|uniref:hypothetical protein n=1 Tax=Streptomyces bauhiniae TaxID=2340725 RepID=UPI0033BA5B8E